jgi:hypothetical protein
VLATLRAGYDRRSLAALGALACACAFVLWRWQEVFDFSANDALLYAIWAAMAAILCWRVDARRDVPRVLAGLAGGLVIEAWGTVTELWTYSSRERPPLWIIPAWPVATLAIDRIARVIEPALPPRAGRVTVAALLAFAAWMAWFARPTWGSPATWLAIVAMLAVALTPKDDRQDLSLLLGGTALGIFLEYWGTSRASWTYWTHETPPPVAAVAHGFSAVAFQRTISVVEQARRDHARASTGPAGPRVRGV